MTKPLSVSKQLKISGAGDEFLSPEDPKGIRALAHYYGMKVKINKIQVIRGDKVLPVSLVTVLTPRQQKEAKHETKARIVDMMTSDNLGGIVRQAKALKETTRDLESAQSTLSTVAKRIAREIYDSNKGGTPERDKVKRFEEEVSLANELIDKLECYGN